MNLIRTIKQKLLGHFDGSCCCGSHGRPQVDNASTKITREMIVRDVTDRWPQTVAIFGNHKVDFCCGGAHSIEQTAHARGCADIDALVADLNQAIK